MVYPLPANESNRIEALYSYDILNTLPEVLFDDLVLLASTICKTPIAAINFIDKDRQLFKASIGLDIKESPRDKAFCTYTILEDNTMIVSDTKTDSRFFDNPFVTQLGIRFYAGTPLINNDGEEIGTICVMDKVPRELTESQIRSLEALSKQVMTQLELKKSLINIYENKKKLEESENKYKLLSESLKEINHELQNKSEILQSIIESVGDGIIVTDEKCNFIVFNESAEIILGVGKTDASPEEWSKIYGEFLTDRVTPFPPDQLPLIRAIKGESVDRIEMFICNESKPEGTYISVTGRPLVNIEGKVYGGVVTLRDITKSKLSEKALKESEERFRKLATISLEGITINDKGKVIDANQSMADMFGYTPEEIIGKKPEDFTSSESLSLIKKNINSMNELPYVAIGVKKDGSKFPVEIISRNINFEGQLYRVTSVRDITDKKNMENSLLESLKKFQTIFEYSPVGIAMVGLDQKWKKINPALSRITGYTEEELSNKSFQLFTHPDDCSIGLDFENKLINKEILSGQVEKRYTKN